MKEAYEGQKALHALLDSLKDYKMTEEEMTNQCIEIVLGEARHQGDTALTREQARQLVLEAQALERCLPPPKKTA